MKTAAPFLLVDDFLPEDEWELLWSYFQVCRFEPVPRAGRYAWGIHDGQSYWSKLIAAGNPALPSSSNQMHGESLHAEWFPTDTPLDPLIRRILEYSGRLEPVVGSEWVGVLARPQIYPVGAGLDWHKDDHTTYTGAFIYWVHPEWNVRWGGELLIADASTGEEVPSSFRFDNDELSEALLSGGNGRFVFPKPNRLIVLGDSPHMIAKVSPAAGASVRASVAGFFLRPGL